MNRTDTPLDTPATKPYRPWGLLIVLGVYAIGALFYVWSAYWSSPEYQAAEHYEDAAELLGRDEGRSASQEELLEAYGHLLEAGRLMPTVKTFHDLTESLNWRFDERGLTVPVELRRRAEANATVFTRIMNERKPILVVGLRDRGWGHEQVLAGPRQVALWAPVGALLIVAFWAYLRFSGKRVQAQEKEQTLQQLEHEVEELGAFRRRGD